MGKRELLLIVAFVVAGIVLYRASAPPRPRSGLGLGDVARRLVRELRPERARGEARRSLTHPVAPSTSEVRVRGIARAAVTGETRSDLLAELVVTSSGVDAAEATRLASAATLRVETAADTLVFTVDYPPEGRQEAALTLRVPARLRVRAEDVPSGVRASDVAAVALASVRGPTTLARIGGTVEGDHRSGAVEIAEAGAVRLRTRGAALRLERVRGAVVLDLAGGSLRARALGGPLQLDARSASLDIDDVAGPVEASVAGGRFALSGAGGTVRVDAQGADVALRLARAVEVTAFVTRAALDIALPAASGVGLDAVATDGTIRVEGFDLSVAREGRVSRVEGAIGGGGPRVSLRVTRGPITIRRFGGSRR
jgi:hypothetical protein